MPGWYDANRNYTSGRILRSGALRPGLGGAVGEILAAALRGLENAADLVFDESQRQVPVLDPAQESKGRTSGELKASGRVEMEPKQKLAAIHYGTEYATYQHERMDLKHPNGGNAKFLERPMLDMREQELEAIAAEIRKVTE